MKKLLSLILALVLAVSLAVPVLAATSPFPDVPNGAWYADGVRYVVEHNIFTGNTDGTFNPKGAMTRGMFVVALCRLLGIDPTGYKPSLDPNSDTFDDVPAGMWCRDAIRRMYVYIHDEAAGTRDNRLFRPNDPITREEIAVILYNYLRIKGLELEQDPAAPPVFTDMASVSTAGGRDAVEHMRRVGLMTGSNGQFNPQGELSRAEAAVAFMRFDQCLAKAHNTEGNNLWTPTLVLMPSNFDSKTRSIFPWFITLHTMEPADGSLIQMDQKEGSISVARELEPGSAPIETYVDVTYLPRSEVFRVNVTVIPPDAGSANTPEPSEPKQDTPSPDDERDLTPFTVTTPSFSFETSIHENYITGYSKWVAGRIRITDPYWGLTDETIIDDSYGYTFSSSDPSVVKVNSKGELKEPRLLAPDDAPVKAVITVTNQRDGHSVEVPVTISPDPKWYTVDDDYIEAYAAEVLRLVNKLRAEAGAEPLAYAYEYQEAINTRTARLEKNFAHDGIGVPSNAAENIIAGGATGPNHGCHWSPEETAEGFVERWKNSKYHYRNMVNPKYTQIAVGLYVGEAGWGSCGYSTQWFLR